MKWIVSLPDVGTNSYAIGAKNKEQEFIFDWIIQAVHPKTQVINGSFEEVAISAAVQFYKGEELPGWRALKTDLSNCVDPDPFVEVQQVNNIWGIVAAEGKQWMETDATCQASGLGGPGGAGITYQDIVTEADHIYEVVVSYRRRHYNESDEVLRVSFEGKILWEQKITNDDWRTLKLTHKARGKSSRLEFEERGASDRYGPLVDNVRIYDLGHLPTN